MPPPGEDLVSYERHMRALQAGSKKVICHCPLIQGMMARSFALTRAEILERGYDITTLFNRFPFCRRLKRYLYLVSINLHMYMHWYTCRGHVSHLWWDMSIWHYIGTYIHEHINIHSWKYIYIHLCTFSWSLLPKLLCLTPLPTSVDGWNAGVVGRWHTQDFFSAIM